MILKRLLTADGLFNYALNNTVPLSAETRLQLGYGFWGEKAKLA